MLEMQVSPAMYATVGCVIMCVLSVTSAVIFCKKNGNKGENPGTVLSIILGMPFFASLCYLLCCVMAKIGETI